MRVVVGVQGFSKQMRSDRRVHRKPINLYLLLAVAATLVMALVTVFFLSDNTPSENYTGDLKNDLPHGFGLWKHPGGAYYAGEFFEGVRQGRGIWTHPDGIKYAGHWLSGEYHGRGTLLLPGGARYIGEWVGGKKEGPGIYRWPDGKTYSGYWSADRHAGYGKLETPEGFYYAGNWHDGRKQGIGNATYPDSSSYYGQWLNDKRHGSGTLLYADGSIYEGGWAEDLQHGEGTITYTNGTTRTAVWTKGSLQEVNVESITIDPESLTLVAGGATATLTTDILPADATNPDVSWESSNPSVASVSDTGVVRPLKSGSATITATTIDGGLTAICTVSVGTTAVSVTGVRLDRTSITLRVGETATLIATVSPSGATNPTVNWTSSNSAVAAVYQETGRRGGVRAFAPGEVTITVRTIDGRHTAQCQVTILPKEDPSNKVITPRLIGKLISEARSLITEAGLAIGDVRSEYHPTAPPDQVISQNPAVGASVNKGSLVNLVISRGPEPVPEPDPGEDDDDDDDENSDIIPEGDGD
jgi:hypothetical protein